MKKVALSLAFAVAVALTLAFALPRPAMAWTCTLVGPGDTYSCVDSNGTVWSVNCGGGRCTYVRHRDL